MNFPLKAPWIMICGCFFAFIAVVIGAFSAHALKASLGLESLQLMETASRYQMYHALALLFSGLLIQLIPSRKEWIKKASTSFVTGIALFCGALYIIALTGIKWFGVIAPVGGIAFIIGWIMLIITILQGAKA